VKRSLPPLHLKRSPLVMVLTQVRFSAVMALEKFVPEIQEQLRHKGFPRYLRGQIQEFLVQPDSPPKFSLTDRFEFQEKGGNTGIVLTPTSVAVQTNSYSRFEDFEEVIATAIIVVNRVLNISLVERVGLRYVDLVRVGENEHLRDFLKPGLLGIDPASVGIKSWLSRYESIGSTDLGKLVVRCSQSEQILPPDLFPTTLNYSIVPKPGEVVTLLDFDHFVEKSGDFDTRGVVSLVGELHDAVDHAFRGSVTENALARWGNEEDK
jgi:uncharacterized protein (TIGR04255 family)